MAAVSTTGIHDFIVENISNLRREVSEWDDTIVRHAAGTIDHWPPAQYLSENFDGTLNGFAKLGNRLSTEKAQTSF